MWAYWDVQKKLEWVLEDDVFLVDDKTIIYKSFAPGDCVYFYSDEETSKVYGKVLEHEPTDLVKIVTDDSHNVVQISAPYVFKTRMEFVTDPVMEDYDNNNYGAIIAAWSKFLIGKRISDLVWENGRMTGIKFVGGAEVFITKKGILGTEITIKKEASK